MTVEEATRNLEVCESNYKNTYNELLRNGRLVGDQTLAKADVDVALSTWTPIGIGVLLSGATIFMIPIAIIIFVLGIIIGVVSHNNAKQKKEEVAVCRALLNEQIDKITSTGLAA